jgi:hypothetical protein
MLLCDAQIHNTSKVKMQCNTGTVINLGSLYLLFQRLGDKRQRKGKRYALATILLGMFLAKLCGEDKPSGIAKWVALRGEWIASVQGLKRKSIPSHHTYRRILADVVDGDEFEALARVHHRRHGKAGYYVVFSMDGKVIRGTIDLEASDGLCLLAVFLPEESLLSLRGDYLEHVRVGRRQERLEQILDLIFQRPILNVRQAEAVLGIPYLTAER